MTPFAFYGTFMSDQPGHTNLDGARLLGRARTAPQFRLYVVDEMWPALVRAEDGVEIECELYEVEPPGWNRGPVELADGRVVEAFVADSVLLARGDDISEYGGWAGYRAALA